MLEKEPRWAAHQTGHNSGVIHAGLYYKPGSLKAAMAVAGNKSMLEFARENEVPTEVCGKLVVATEPDELPRLSALADRARANGVPATMIDPARAREFEPEVHCLAALHVESTGITDYTRISLAMAAHVEKAGAGSPDRKRGAGDPVAHRRAAAWTWPPAAGSCTRTRS